MREGERGKRIKMGYESECVGTGEEQGKTLGELAVYFRFSGVTKTRQQTWLGPRLVRTLYVCHRRNPETDIKSMPA